MRAVVVTESGGPELLTYQEVPDPVPGTGEVLVEVAAVSSEGGGLRGRRGAPTDWLPLAPGFSAAGTAAAVGEGVTAGHLESGETVLVRGATGGVGVAAAELAHRAGATVLATASSEDAAVRLRELGTDDVIRYREDDLVGKVKKLSGDRGVELLLELVGGPAFPGVLDAVSAGGRWWGSGRPAGRRPSSVCGISVHGRSLRRVSSSAGRCTCRGFIRWSTGSSDSWRPVSCPCRWHGHSPCLRQWRPTASLKRSIRSGAWCWSPDREPAGDVPVGHGIPDGWCQRRVRYSVVSGVGGRRLTLPGTRWTHTTDSLKGDRYSDDPSPPRTLQPSLPARRHHRG